MRARGSRTATSLLRAPKHVSKYTKLSRGVPALVSGSPHTITFDVEPEMSVWTVAILYIGANNGSGTAAEAALLLLLLLRRLLFPPAVLPNPSTSVVVVLVVVVVVVGVVSASQ